MTASWQPPSLQPPLEARNPPWPGKVVPAYSFLAVQRGDVPVTTPAPSLPATTATG